MAEIHKIMHCKSYTRTLTKVMKITSNINRLLDFMHEKSIIGMLSFSQYILLMTLMTKAISYYNYYSHVYLTMDKKYGDSINNN